MARSKMCMVCISVCRHWWNSKQCLCIWPAGWLFCY